MDDTQFGQQLSKFTPEQRGQIANTFMNDKKYNVSDQTYTSKDGTVKKAPEWVDSVIGEAHNTGAIKLNGWEQDAMNARYGTGITKFSAKAGNFVRGIANTIGGGQDFGQYIGTKLGKAFGSKDKATQDMLARSEKEVGGGSAAFDLAASAPGGKLLGKGLELGARVAKDTAVAEKVIKPISKMVSNVGAKVTGGLAIGQVAKENAGKILKKGEGAISSELKDLAKTGVVSKDDAVKAGLKISQSTVTGNTLARVGPELQGAVKDLANNKVISRGFSTAKNIEQIEEHVSKQVEDKISEYGAKNILIPKDGLISGIEKTVTSNPEIKRWMSDKTFQNGIKTVSDTFGEALKSQKGNLEGLLKARYEFRKVAQSRFGDLFASDKYGSALKQIVKSYDSAINSSITKALPEESKKDFIEFLKKQHNLLNVKDLYESKFASEYGKSWWERNPKITKTAKAVGATAALGLAGSTAIPYFIKREGNN